MVTHQLVVALSDGEARTPSMVGHPAARLGLGWAEGLPVLWATMLTVTAVQQLRTGASTDPGRDPLGEALWRAWGQASADAILPVAVSRSPLEPGRRPLPSVRLGNLAGWRDFRDAVTTLVVPDPDDAGGFHGLLVQPEIAAQAAGVVLGADPFTGHGPPLVVATSSLRAGGRFDWRSVPGSGSPEPGLAGMGHAELGCRLTDLAARAAALFGGPQDLEWVEDQAGRIWITAVVPLEPYW
ncbi:MAG: hypothetical protein AB1679_30380 [Actinomycetota bacterium]